MIVRNVCQMGQVHLPRSSEVSCLHVSSGTVLMETVLVLPVLTLLIFAIVQFSLIWYAQIMVHYAAYNAARAALVYHPGEYQEKDDQYNTTGVFLSRSGPCWEAACSTLAWVSSSPPWDSDAMGGVGAEYRVPGWWQDNVIPNSGHVRRQVRIVPSESSEGLGTNAPVVKVTVEFDFPLYVPVVGRMLSYFDKIDRPSQWEVWGWCSDADGMAQLDLRLHPTMKTDYVTLKAVSMMPKLWKTSCFARLDEKISE